MSSFPFRFYGSGCSDWYEGANQGHAFSVRFAAAPSEADAVLIARELEGSLQSGPVELGRAWLWSGPCAHFYVGERWERNSAVGASHVQRMGEVLKRLHTIFPIVDIVYAGARAGGDAWSEWSVEQGSPAAGPRIPSFEWVGLYGRAVDPELPEPQVWEAFEAARTAQRAQLADSAFDAKLAAQSGERVKLVEVRDGYLAPDLYREAPAALALAIPNRVQYEGRWLLAEGDHPLRPRAQGPIIAVVVRHGANGHYSYADIAWVDSSGNRRQPNWELPAKQQVSVQDAHPELPVLLVKTGPKLWEVQLETGDAAALYDAACDVGMYLGGSTRLALIHAGKVSVVRRSGEGWEPVAQVADPHAAIEACLGPDGFITQKYGKGARLYRLVGDKLKKVAATPLDISFAFERDNELYFHRGGRLFHWEGAADAWRAAGEKAPKARRTSAAAKQKAQAPAFVAGLALPELPWAKSEWALRVRGQGSMAVSSRGDVAEYHGSSAQMFHYNQLSYRAAEGEILDLSAQIAPPLAAGSGVIEQIYFDRDDHLVVMSGRQLFRVIAEPFSYEKFADLNTLGMRHTNSAMCHGGLVVASWTDTVAFARLGQDTFESAAKFSLRGTHRVLFVDGVREIALVAHERGGACILQRQGAQVKRVAKYTGQVSRCFRVQERLFVAQGDESVCEVEGVLISHE